MSATPRHDCEGFPFNEYSYVQVPSVDLHTPVSDSPARSDTHNYIFPHQARLQAVPCFKAPPLYVATNLVYNPSVNPSPEHIAMQDIPDPGGLHNRGVVAAARLPSATAPRPFPLGSRASVLALEAS